MIARDKSHKVVKTMKKQKDSEDGLSGESGLLGEDSAVSEDAEGSEDERTIGDSNPGWADAMQKILRTNKPAKKKTIVLSKAKKLREVKVTRSEELAVPFEIEGEDGRVKRETLPKEEKEESETIPAKRKRRDAPLGIRTKPSTRDRERERMLQKIATKGVVQLFNVVKQQQVDIEKKMSEVGPLERKREQVLKSIDKRAFLDVLMGGSKSISVRDATTGEEDEKPSDKVWNVLGDDFAMGAKLKDWDKKAPETDNESTSSEEMDSD